MRIIVELAFDEAAALRLLNWLAQENARIFLSHPNLPGLYQSGVKYKPERDEEWADYINLLLKGHEDCDALAAARAGELMARGAEALSLDAGDYGARRARELGLRHIRAKVILRTRLEPGETGLYHCIVKYWVDGRVFYDDPSARLGMWTGGRVTRQTLNQPTMKQPVYYEYLHTELPSPTSSSSRRRAR